MICDYDFSEIVHSIQFIHLNLIHFNLTEFKNTYTIKALPFEECFFNTHRSMLWGTIVLSIVFL